MINTMADQENVPNTQQLNNNRMDGKAANSISNLRDNKSVKSLVSGISVSVRTGNNMQMSAKSDF